VAKSYEKPKITRYRRTRGLVVTQPSVDRKKAHLRTTNTFISILFLREESSRQRYLDSYLQDNSGDMQYSASNPVRTEFHFSALHHGDYDVLWGAELWFVVCGLWLCVGALNRGCAKKKKIHRVGILPLSI
jgi:hypothetical protein